MHSEEGHERLTTLGWEAAQVHREIAGDRVHGGGVETQYLETGKAARDRTLPKPGNRIAHALGPWALVAAQDLPWLPQARQRAVSLR